MIPRVSTHDDEEGGRPSDATDRESGGGREKSCKTEADAEVSAADRERSRYSRVFAQRHPLRKLTERDRKRHVSRERARELPRKPTKQAAMASGDGPRRQPPMVSRPSCHEARGANCATIWFTSSARRERAPRWPREDGT